MELKNTIFLKSSVGADGTFECGIHRPHYQVKNLREEDPSPGVLGLTPDGLPVDNRINFPEGRVEVPEADWIYEIANPLPFRGTTYIAKSWAESKVEDPAQIALPPESATSMSQFLQALGSPLKPKERQRLFARLPLTVLMALAAHSTDPDDLTAIAQISCQLILDDDGRPTGLRYEDGGKGPRPIIHHHNLFEVVVNNPALPMEFREVMVLRPGVQGGSEIVGDFQKEETHIFEYLRRNSYIPWGHFAANMANDAIRYDMGELSRDDINGLRHLYYQRTFCRMAQELGLGDLADRQRLSEEELESLRRQVYKHIRHKRPQLRYNATLWGWNYGFSCAANGYRMHASHQMIHQQFALIPRLIRDENGGDFTPYAVGDLTAEFIRSYYKRYKRPFFENYIRAIRANERLDGRPDLPKSLVLFEDENVILFVPKAQTSQWELQLISLAPCGNILEADRNLRRSLNEGMFRAVQTLHQLGARMITTIEISKRFDDFSMDQRLLYSFLPKLPYSPGAFSEAQLRWINGHYPEDFARACRGVWRDKVHST